MSNKKTKILKFNWPILHGSVSSAMAKCGQKNCRCQKDKKALHGPYYRWIGNINSKKTTRTISKEVAQECRRQIKNYEKLQQQIDQLLKNAIDSAPWKS
jgi:tRNA G26 N,N-dimethylase Trm1